MKIADRRKDLRPREKLQSRGAASLSDYELLMAIIGSGNLEPSQADLEVTERPREAGESLSVGRISTGSYYSYTGFFH